MWDSFGISARLWEIFEEIGESLGKSAQVLRKFSDRGYCK